MKLGDRVEYIGTDIPELTGKQGILRTAMRGYAGVEFDENVPEGHDLNGHCPEKKGLYLPANEVSVVPKFHLGEWVYSVLRDSYGFFGEIISIEDILDNEAKSYKVQDDCGQVKEIDEGYLASSEDFVPCPLKVGDYVKLKPSDVGYNLVASEELLNHWFGYPKKVAYILYDQFENNFEIDVQLDDEVVFRTSPERVEVVPEYELQRVQNNFAEYIRSIVDTDYTQIKEEFHKGIFQNMNYARSGHSSDFRVNMMRVLLGMLYMPTPEKMEKMGPDLQTYTSNLNYDVYTWSPGEVFEEIGFSRVYNNGYKWFMLPLVKENTREAFENSLRLAVDVEKTQFGCHIKDEGEQDHWVVYYDLFDFESAIRSLCNIQNNPESELWNLLVTHKYDEAFSLFKQWNTQFEECLVKSKKLYDIQRSLAYLQSQEENRITEELSEIERDIRDYQNSLSDLFSRQRDTQLQLLGIKAGKNNEMNDLLLPFLKGMGDNLVALDVSNGRFVAQIKQPLLYLERELYHETNIRKGYERDYPVITLDILDDIVDGKITVMMEETVSIRLGGTYPISCLQRESTGECMKVKEGIPNPHHYYYNCWGQNESPIKSAFSCGNYVVGLNQIMAAIAGVNVAEGPTMENLIKLIDALRKGTDRYWNTNPCISYNGEKMTVKQYADIRRGRKD